MSKAALFFCLCAVILGTLQIAAAETVNPPTGLPHTDGQKPLKRGPDDPIRQQVARYIENWKARVEHVGKRHFPRTEQGSLYGSVTVDVLIEHTGKLLEASVVKSSGNPALDAAALRIVRAASPYPAFPPAMRNEMDELGFIRTLTFSRAQTQDAH